MSIHKKTGKRGTSYQVQWRDQEGKQQAKRFPTRKAAEAFEHQIKLNKFRGLVPSQEGQRIKFAEYTKRWLATKTEHRERTAKRRDGILRLHILPTLGNQSLSSISTADINNLMMKWQKAGLKPRTIRQHIAFLRQILNMAFDEDLIYRNPINGVKLPKPGPVKRQSLTDVQANLLISEIAVHFRPFVRFALLSGLRFDEIVNLKISDVDHPNSVVHIRQAKTDAGVRDIALTDEELGYLTTYIESARLGASNDDLLFVTLRGCKIHHGNFMKRVFIPAVQRTGLDDLRPHDLRRTSATILAETGVPPTSTKNRMGHDSFSTTDKYYVVPTKASQQATAGIVSSVLKLDLTNRDELA